jgi:AcrR family transcriptional regulator
MMMTSMRSSTQKKRQLVIETALQMFTDKGFENVSVDDIIAATGTSKGTFYHYFKSKDDIVADMGRSQNEIISKWNQRGPTQVKSLEGHINRLFLDLCENIQHNHKLMRSLFTLTLHNELVQKQQMEQMQLLYDGLYRWLPQAKKVQLLVTTYMGTLLIWSIDGEDNLMQIMQEQLTGIWNGIRQSDEEDTFIVEEGPYAG